MVPCSRICLNFLGYPFLLWISNRSAQHPSCITLNIYGLCWYVLLCTYSACTCMVVFCRRRVTFTAQVNLRLVKFFWKMWCLVVSVTRGEDCFAISTYPVHQRQHLCGRLRALFGQLGAMLSELFTNWTIYTNKVGASPTNSAAVAAPAVLRFENQSSFWHCQHGWNACRRRCWWCCCSWSRSTWRSASCRTWCARRHGVPHGVLASPSIPISTSLAAAVLVLLEEQEEEGRI